MSRMITGNSIGSMSSGSSGALNNSDIRVVAVSGANKGIGFQIALQLAACGLFQHVIMGCRDAKRGQAALHEIQDKLETTHSTGSPHAELSCYPLEVGNEESHKAFHKRVEDTFGKLDVLVNNAGFAFKGTDPTPFAKQTKPTLDINFRGTVDLTEELLPLVRKSTDGRIVNVASMTGRLSQISSSELRSKLTSPSLTMTELRKLLDDFESDVENGIHTENGWGNSNYGMSKLALIAATKVMARDEILARSSVKVNACCPGYCVTDMTSRKGSQSASHGARTPVLLATMDLKDCTTGEFYENMAKSEW